MAERQNVRLGRRARASGEVSDEGADALATLKESTSLKHLEVTLRDSGVRGRGALSGKVDWRSSAKGKYAELDAGGACA